MTTVPQSGFSVIQLRRSTAAFWELSNPILRKGEMGYDITNKQVKIGDGTTAWNSLYYSTVPDVNIDDPQDDQALVYDTGQWINKTPIAAASVAKTKPSPATDGALWFDPEDARLYRYYDDGAGAAQWVEINQTIAQQSNTFTSGVTIGGTLSVTGTTTLGAANITTANLTNPLTVADGGTGATTGSGLVPIIPTSVAVGSGSASVGTNGLVTFTGASSILLNGVFSSSYKNYKVYFSAPATTSNTANANRIYIRFSTGGTVNTTSNYTYTQSYTQTTSLVNSGIGTGSGTNVAVLEFVQDSEVTVFAPFENNRGTNATFVNSYQHTNLWGQFGFNTSTSFDGIQFFNNTYTGNVQVYGMRN
jgi:hypothetical protein